MTDERVEKLAKLFVNYSVNIQSKEKVVIQGKAQAFPLIDQLYRECLLADAYPHILAQVDSEYTFYKTAKDHQLTHVSPFVKFMVENTDVMIGIFCDTNPKRLTNVNPEKIRKHQAALSELTQILFRREAEGKYRWGGLPYPFTAEAQEAEMALEEYEDFVYSSCLLDKEDPIAEWKKIRKEQNRLCTFLNHADKIRVVGEETDISLSVKGRKWINCSGEKNMPDGEVYTSPVESSVNGKIRFTYPGIFQGTEIEDICLTFKAGKVTKASAQKGEKLLGEILKIKGADRLGEVAIGTNYGITKFTKNMLFDEKMGGTIHTALGFNPTPQTGGKNKSAIHWDILKDMKKNSEIYANGKLFFKNGRFLAHTS